MLKQDGKDVPLHNLILALLRLHKALLDDERVSYERVHGRIPSNGMFLQLALNDAWFAWLRPLSQLMAQIDEFSEQDTHSNREGLPALLISLRTLLTPAEVGDGFGKQYYEALQRGPEVVLAHAEVRASLMQVAPTKG